MGKGKPRHHPEKPQNQYGGDGWCDACDETKDGKLYCEYLGDVVTDICHGNRHNCCKVRYKQWAGKNPKKEHPSVRYMER